jgi:hypothetical protein
MIRSHSLHQANVVFLFREPLTPPENADFTRLFSGAEAEGMNFMDNAVMQAKMLSVPKLGVSVVWEGNRLRIEDQKQREPEDSTLMADAIRAYEKLFVNRNMALEGFGFNFDTYYQTKEVIRIDDHLSKLYPAGLMMGNTLLDIGWQWTMAEKDGNHIHGYFVKVTAPIEFMMHYNAHTKIDTMPTEKELTTLFKKAYEAMNQTAELLQL